MRRASALALILAASCSRCGAPESAASAEELLGQNPSAAVVTAPLGAVAGHFAALAGIAASLPGGEQLGDLRKGLASQLGFDPFTREGLLAAGLDPDRGAALALFTDAPATGLRPSRPEWAVALPLTNPDQFAKTVQRLLVERLGASPGKQPQSFERGGSIIAWRVVRGYGILARGADPTPRLDAPKVEESLARAPGLLAAKQKLGAQDVIVWAPSGSELPRRYTSRPLHGDVALSVQAAPRGLALRLLAQLPPSDAAQARAALPGGGAALVELLPGDAPLRMRLGVSASKLFELARSQPQAAELLNRLPAAASVFAALQPGAALSLGIAKNASIAQAIDYGLDFRRKSPFDTVQLVALAQPADKDRLLAAFEALAKELPTTGAQVKRSGGGAADDFQITYAGLKGARFGVREIAGKPIAYLLGGDLAPEDLKRLPKTANPEGAALYEEAGAAGRADFGKLDAAIHALPDSTYGSGPQSYVTRSIVSQVIDPLRPLRLTLAVQAQPDFLGATLDLEIAAP